MCAATCVQAEGTMARLKVFINIISSEFAVRIFSFSILAVNHVKGGTRLESVGRRDPLMRCNPGVVTSLWCGHDGRGE